MVYTWYIPTIYLVRVPDDQYLRTWVNSWASNQHWRQATSNLNGHGHWITTVTENPLGRSKTWAEAQVWKSRRFSCALWSANLLHQVWRSCEFLVLLPIRLFNYKTKFIPFLNQFRSIQLKDRLWVILLIEISIQLLWGSANESRTIVVTLASLINIWTWEECLNYLQSHPRHSNHFSTFQSPSALLSFSPDQLFVLSLWLNFWTWQNCLNILHSYPRHS